MTVSLWRWPTVRAITWSRSRAIATFRVYAMIVLYERLWTGGVCKVVMENIRPKRACGLLRRICGVGARARKLTLAALVLAVATFGVVPTVAQAQQDCAAISALTLTSDTPGVLDVSWYAPTGAAPTDYRVNWARSGEDYPPWTDDTANHHPTTTSQQLTDLDEGVEYKVRVRARYYDGARAKNPCSGPWAEATRQVATQPVVQVQQDDGSISALTLTSDTPGVLDVSWDAPTGAAPTDYRVNWARSGEDYPPWTDDTANHQPTTTSQQLTDLDEGVEYKVRVRARYHDGPWSGPWAEATRQVASEPPPVVRSAVDPPVTLAPSQLTVIEPDDPDDPDDPPVALQQSDGSVSEPADGDLPADTTTTGLLIVNGNGVTGRHTDNVTHRHLNSDGERYHFIHPHLYSAEDVDWYAVDLQANVYYQFDVKTGGNLPVYRLKIYDSAGNPVMVTVGTGMNERQVAVDNNYGVGGLRNSHSDLLNALPFTTTMAGTYYVSIQGQWGGIAPNRVYTLSVQSDDHPNDPTTTADVAVGGSIRTYIMRTETNASSTSTSDTDWVKVALVAGTRYRFVWDVACLHEGVIGIRDSEILVEASISRETDGWCTDLTVEFTPPVGGDYFISVTARGSDFPEVPRYPFKGVWGTLTVIGPGLTVRFGDGSYTATEGGTEATVEVILSEDPERPVTVPLEVTELGGATAGDYTGLPESVTFTAGQTTASFMVTAVDDTADDDDESIRIGFGTLPTAVTAASPDSTTVSLVDNDLQPVTVRFGDGPYTATEGGTEATVEVILSEDPERPVTVPLEVTELGGATAGDYTGLPESVTFNAGQTTASFMVTAVDDTVDDDDESIRIGFGTLPAGVTAASPDSTTVSLADNDNSPAQGAPLPRGERKVGATLTADTSGITDADGLTGVVLAYRWQHVDGGTPADITGAMSDTYTLTADDLGKRIQLQVQFTDDNNSTETLTGPATSLVVAEPRLLVGNFDSQAGLNSGSDRSNGFVTGTHPLGYAIDSIQMKRNPTNFVSSAFGEFRLYDSTVNSDRLLRKPASRLVTVTGPDRVSGNTLTFAPSKVKLDPDTTYHAVLTRSQGGAIGCNLAGSGLDSGSLAGFSIIPRSYLYQGTTYQNPCGLKIRGFELVSSSFVERVEFTSSPALTGMYATGEAIEATVTLSEAVMFADPSPVLLLQVGANEREMAYVASASTATSWVFRYTVAAGDRDDGGVSLERNALRGYADADLSHRGIGDDRTRRVNAAPLVVSRRVTSSPVAPSWYGPGEKIKFTVEFSLPVTVSGDPELEFNVTTPAGVNERATYASGSGTTELVFSYTVGTGDDDSDGIWWGADSLKLGIGDSITGDYNGVAAVLDHSQVGFLTSHKIDQNPRAVSQKVTSDPTHGTNSDTYGAGDIITFEVVFNQTVTVTGEPQLRISVTGPGDEYADYTGGSGTNTLAFSYTVLATETDPDGIYLYRNPLTLETGESILGTANNLPPEGDIGREGPLSGHKIDGSITN